MFSFYVHVSHYSDLVQLCLPGVSSLPHSLLYIFIVAVSLCQLICVLILFSLPCFFNAYFGFCSWFSVLVCSTSCCIPSSFSEVCIWVPFCTPWCLKKIKRPRPQEPQVSGFQYQINGSLAPHDHRWNNKMKMELLDFTFRVSCKPARCPTGIFE